MAGNCEVSSGLVEAALEISARRRETLGHLKTALEQGEEETALKLARKLCGMDADEQKSDRADKSLH